MIALGVRMAQLETTALVADDLGELREELFHHFAREEEGLFPFVTDVFPEHAAQVETMATAHDAICGALARAYHLATSNADAAIVISIYNRFEQAYAAHARAESELFDELGAKLTLAQSVRLAELVRDL